jgi:hypothetical protein
LSSIPYCLGEILTPSTNSQQIKVLGTGRSYIISDCI